MPKRLLLLTVPALAAIAVAIPTMASGASTAAVSCPTFRVLHNDRIGKIYLPAGTYAVTVNNLSCSDSTALFARFLEDWDGVLPRPWKASSTGTGQITFRGGRQSFSARRQGGGGGGGLVCPSAYNLRHSDHIGKLFLRAGKYRITRLSTISPSCRKSSRLLTGFLEDFDGDLPGNWAVLAQTGTFLDGSVENGFRVEPWAGGGGGNTPDSRKEVRCPGVFRVLHNDRIGPLRYPAGPYTIDVRRMKCRHASNLFANFLQSPSGNITGGWRIKKSTGTFQRGRKSFQPKPAFDAS